jgi:hypothetical protein
MQLTDTRCRVLSESHYEGDVKRYSTFLDADEFISNWGFGADNCGKETSTKAKGIIKRSGDSVTCPAAPEQIMDTIGRYTVEMDGKSYDTVLVMCIEHNRTGAVMTETYVDENGRTVLWRRFNRDDWAISRYKIRWSEKLPDNERVKVNGETFVHWYDCLTEYIL